MENGKNLRRDLDQDPPDDGIGGPHAVDMATFELLEKPFAHRSGDFADLLPPSLGDTGSRCRGGRPPKLPRLRFSKNIVTTGKSYLIYSDEWEALISAEPHTPPSA